MPSVAPNGFIYILHNCPLDNTYDHTVLFGSFQGQIDYLQTLIKYTLTDQSYTRVGPDKIRVQIPYDSLYDCNYLFFKNAEHDKMFFAFITSTLYINNAVTEIDFEVDVLQTYMFDYQLRPCFVEREHAMTDQIGDNIVPEPVALGEYVYNHNPVPLRADNFRNFVIVAICDVGTSSGSSSGGGGGGSTTTETDITGTLTNGYYWDDATGARRENAYGVASAPINIEGLTKITITHTSPSAYNCFYTDANANPSTFISSFSCILGDTHIGDDASISIPSNAKYMTVSNTVADDIRVVSITDTPAPSPSPTPSPSTPAVDGAVYDGIYGGATLWVYRADDVSSINAKLNEYVQKPESIVSVYTCNSLSVNLSDVPEGGAKLEQTEGISWVGYLGNAITRRTTLDGHSCRNSKLLTYPYNLLHVDNMEGDSLELRYEFFPDLHPQARTLSSVTQPVEVVLYPRNYKGATDAVDTTQSLRVTNYPLCSWAVDSYQAWIAQNAIPRYLKRNLNAIQSVALSAFLGPVAGGISALSGWVNDISQTYTASIQADVMRGSQTAGSATYGHRLKNFFYARMSITAEQAEIIDDFFDRFGYATNRVKVPNVSGRTYWNYVKTRGCLIVGSVPNDFAKKICAIYDKGITFWKSGPNIGNYSLDNRILEA